MNFIVHCDGGARGNPGPAAVGVVIEMSNDKFPMTNERQKTIEISKRIGEATNNVAEYTAVLEGLQEVKSQKSKVKSEVEERTEIQFFLDSTLVVNQLNGLYKVKDGTLRSLLLEIKMVEQEVGGEIRYSSVPREQNRRADWLVNKALDAA